MAFELEENYESGVNIKVVGVGGGGNNAVNRMIATNIKGVEFIAINTDKQALSRSAAAHQISIGTKLTKGHGAGANPEIGESAAEESKDEIGNALKGADMVFITAGMGGGTGTGAAPIVAKAARDLGILTIGIVTKPFAFEGKRRMDAAEKGIAKLRSCVDSLVIIPNERLKQVSETKITLANAFAESDDVLRRGVQSISELINVPGIVNLDFADVTAIMQNGGCAHMGVGHAEGKDKAEEAAKMAISSPLLETSIKGAKGLLINVTVSPDIGLDEIDQACTMITEEADPEANIIWGAAFDETMEDSMQITVIATGFEGADEDQLFVPVTAKREPAPDKQPAPVYGKAGSYDKPAAEPAPAAESSDDIKDPAEELRSFRSEASAPKTAAPRDYTQRRTEEIDDSSETEDNDGGISESDFDDIMNILKKSKRGNY